MKKQRLTVLMVCCALVAFGAFRVLAVVTESSTNVPLAITDAGNINSTLNFSVNGTISDANLTVDITHTWNDDIELRLSSPSVAAQLLWQDCGGSSDNLSVTIDNQAAGLCPCPSTGNITGTFQPTDGTTGTPVAASGTLAAFNGSASGGTWTLNVTDDSSICTGTLNAWSLTLDGAPPLPVELMTLEVS